MSPKTQTLVDAIEEYFRDDKGRKGRLKRINKECAKWVRPMTAKELEKAKEYKCHFRRQNLDRLKDT